jgi:nickel-dependent lactate racemase
VPTPPSTLSDSEIREWMHARVPAGDFRGRRVLVIVPDATRTAPLRLLLDALTEVLAPAVKQLDVMIALGTHPPLSEVQIEALLGLRATGVSERLPGLRVFNHEWDRPDKLAQIGMLSRAETEEISSGLLSEDVPVQINARIHDYDVLLVLGPVFPHEVVGFSGGNKYFFPGISGPELLNFFHWLGALITNRHIIGVKHTPVRSVVDRAAAMVSVERRCIAFVTSGDAQLYGLAYGTPEAAWNVAADLSAQVHLKYMPQPFRQVLSCAPPMYDELWVAGKCMYKLEPIVADGGELIIYAPHLKEISVTHGAWIEQIGYHVRDYFVRQWDRFKHVPRGVLAHSTHVRGDGTFEHGVERARVQVTLASQVPRELCERINLGYRDPAAIDVESFANREHAGVLLVRKAGEYLYRLHADSPRPQSPVQASA